MGRPTIKDVAKLASCSTAAVSLVMNNKDTSISQSTRTRILDAVNELGYRPNQLAVSMITGHSRVLGLIIPDNSNSFFSGLSKAIELAANQVGYALIYGNTNNNPQNDISYLKMFTDRQTDGIIFTKAASQFTKESKECVNFIQKSSIPLVAVDRAIPGIHSILLDHFRGGYIATKHLISLGHTRIGCYTGPHNLVSSRERLKGYQYALESANIKFDENLVFEGNYEFGFEKEAFAYLQRQNVTAIFAFNDLMAIGMYREIYRNGLRIPEDISIVGFDDIPFCDLLSPPLTTVHQPVESIGQCSVKTLLDMIEGRESLHSEQQYKFEPVLAIRNSTGKLRR